MGRSQGVFDRPESPSAGTGPQAACPVGKRTVGIPQAVLPALREHLQTYDAAEWLQEGERLDLDGVRPGDRCRGASPACICVAPET
ncbi:hypothetical protein Acor_66630 [Acrocarpospora corrugata]|uniref:Uncharacterized protein n=1 Tax=Acrocarpospora corrugata TaxID=35763 RepID=A0A5M3W6F3_9ACTN|nr:hypothetical protein Acor_66630 [Acrocarpospora corrugata]